MAAHAYVWKLRQLMAERGMWKTSELAPLLAREGVVLSAAQVYRLVAKAPERLSLDTLAALCRIFSCTPNDLIELAEKTSGQTAHPVGDKARPRRARVAT